MRIIVYATVVQSCFGVCFYPPMYFYLCVYIHTYVLKADHSIPTTVASRTVHICFYYLYYVDLFAGMHGAGLTKQMFMPSGGIVFEISAKLCDAQMVRELTAFVSDWQFGV